MEISLKDCLDNLYTDLNMLKEGEWHPDTYSCNASIRMVERMAEILNIGLQDTRHNHGD